MKKGYVFVLLGACVLGFTSQLALPKKQFTSDSFAVVQNLDSRKSEAPPEHSVADLSADDADIYKEEFVSDLTTPIACGQNLSQYAYYNVGTEQFKFSSNSAIGVQSSAAIHAKILDHSQGLIQSGCQENPYHVNSRFSIPVSGVDNYFHLSDIGIDKFESFYVENVPLEERNGVSLIQGLLEQKFEHCKSNGFEVDGLGAGLFQCVEAHAKNIRGSGSVPIIYMSSPDQYSTLTGRPFVMVCDKAKESISCYTHYRLLPSVDIGYSFKARNLKPEKIIEFDLAIRRSIEKVRVKSS